MLRMAIERMLNDGYYQKIEKSEYKTWQRYTVLPLILIWVVRSLWMWWPRWIRKTFLYEPEAFKTSFAGKFYEYTSIRYLGRIEKSDKGVFDLSKPSYISADNFSETLISIFKEKGAGATDGARIDFALRFNTHQIQPETLRHFLNQWENAGQDPAVFKANLIKWFNETMDRTSGWYKRKIQFILLVLGLLVAIMFNVDTLRIARILAADKDARKQLVDMSIQLSKDSARHENFIRETADSIRVKALDSAYTRITEDIRKANLILGLGWNLKSLQVSDDHTIRTTEKQFQPLLSRVDQYRQLLKQRHVLEARVRQHRLDWITSSNNLYAQFGDTLIVLNDLALATHDSTRNRLTKLLALQRLGIDSTLHQRKGMRGKMLRDSAAWVNTGIYMRAVRDSINRLAGVNFSSIDSVAYEGSPVSGVILYGKTQAGAWDKAWHFLKGVWQNLAGLLITAIALSLGAPFWFGILNKLVSIRSVGVKPEEKTPPTKADSVTVTTDAPVIAPISPVRKKGKDLIEEALLTFGPAIKKVAGVKSVFVGKDSKNSRTVQINVLDSVTAAEITRQYGQLKVGESVINAVVKITGVPRIHNLPEGAIVNASGINGKGSLGCVLQREDTKSLHILSCWHVMKGDLNYAGGDRHRIINDHQGAHLAERWSGGIRDSFDYGIARCLDTASVKSNRALRQKLSIPNGTTITPRDILERDIDEQTVIRYFDIHTQQPVSGKIYAEADEVEIHYPDKTRIMNDVILLVDPAGSKSISQPGNSGSVIFDDDHHALAIIIGGDNDYTYALKLSGLFGVHREMTIA
jgi:hypothetical protein